MKLKLCAVYVLPGLLVLPGVFIAVAIFGDNTSGVSNYYYVQTDLFLRINMWLYPLHCFWKNVTELGDALVLFPLLSILILRSPQSWAAMFGAVPLAGLLCWTGKNWLSMSRPAAILQQSQFNIIGPALTGSSSLPSGHALTVFSIIAILASAMIQSQKCRKKQAGVLVGALLAGVIVAISRVAVGAHWPFDILIGSTLGLLCGGSGILLAQRYRAWWAWIETSKGQIVFGFIMLLWGAYLVQKYVSSFDSGLVVPWFAAACAFVMGLRLLCTATATMNR